MIAAHNARNKEISDRQNTLHKPRKSRNVAQLSWMAVHLARQIKISRHTVLGRPLTLQSSQTDVHHQTDHMAFLKSAFHCVCRNRLCTSDPCYTSTGVCAIHSKLAR